MQPITYDNKGKFSKIYSTFHRHARKSSVDFALVDVDPASDLPVINTFVYEVNIEDDGLDILWLKLRKGSSELKTASTQIFLDEYAYNQMKDLITEKTKHYLTNFFIVDVDVDPKV